MSSAGSVKVRWLTTQQFDQFGLIVFRRMPEDNQSILIETLSGQPTVQSEPALLKKRFHITQKKIPHGASAKKSHHYTPTLKSFKSC